ncbi:MAG: hypothetical protein ABI472_06150 [Ginsengibacter sp.]
MRKIKICADQHQRFPAPSGLHLVTKSNTVNQRLLIPSHHGELETIPVYPSISIIMPFEPKMTSKRELSVSVNNAMVRAEQELLENFQIDLAMLVIEKLKIVVRDLEYSTHKKSIGIFVSPVFEKILYLEMEVKERIIVDNFFTIRDLIKSKKEIRNHLLLVLNEKESKIYFCNNETVLQVFSHRSEFSLHGDTQQNNMDTGFVDKYLRQIDRVLDNVLPSFKVPLFVAGDEKITGQFKNITKHASFIVQYISYDCGNISLHELKLLMGRLLNSKVRQENLRQQLTNASVAAQMVSGIEDVFRKVARHQGRLLLVEKNYHYPSRGGGNKELIDNAIHPYSQLSYIKDEVDDIIEKVLDANGEVEFVDKDGLNDYDHIALIL